MAAAISFFQRPNVKLYGSSFRAESILLSSYIHLKNESYCKFSAESNHNQHKSRHLSIASASALDGPDQETPRPVKGHGPSLWADISFSFDNQGQEKYAETVEALKDEVRRMVVANDIKPKDKMILIDTLERLGLAYHFEKEIEDQIQHIFKFHANDDDDLFTTALHFRLFRQHGYDAPSNVLEKFKDEDNKFQKELIGDTEGLLSLYEASYLRYHEEDILEEAMVFTTNHLNESKLELDSYLQEKVARALKQPIHKGVAIIEARHYISIYEKKEKKNELLLTLARLHFTPLQNLYRKDIDYLSKWWKELNITSKLPYVRDRVVESYLWGVGISFEYEHSLSRIAVAKCLLMAILLNDTYDIATLEELEIFTETLQRWDIEEIDELPNYYMKTVYKVVLDIYKEYDDEMLKQGRSYATSHVIESIKEYARALHKKAKWYKGEETPTFEDHMCSNGVIVSGFDCIVASYLMPMGSASKEDFDWLRSDSIFLEIAGNLNRYMNDISSYDREHALGQFPLSIDCYMRENSVSKEDTLDKFLEFIEDIWKTMNKEWTLSCAPRYRYRMKLFLNCMRLTHATYSDGKDRFTSPDKSLKHDLIALFVDLIHT